MKIKLAPHTNPDLPASAAVLFIADQFACPVGGPAGPVFQCALYKLVPNENAGEDQPAEIEETVLSGIQVQMSLDQWNSWTTQDDKKYIGDFVLSKLQLSRKL